MQLEIDKKINHEQLKLLIVGIASFIENAKVVYPRERLSICRDLEDNMILECCLEAKADLLITGDKDFLEIKAQDLKAVGLGRLKILTPRDYIHLRGANQTARSTK